MIFSIFIHPSSILLLFLLLYRRINVKIFICFLVVVLCLLFFNPMFVFYSMISLLNGPELLLQKTYTYSFQLSGFESSFRYILTFLVFVFLVLFLVKKNKLTNSNKMFLIYILLILVNMANPHNFVRFINLSHFMYSFVLIELFSLIRKRENILMLYFYVAFFFIQNYIVTYGRTLGGFYTSSYMDNSLVSILFSNVFMFLSYDAGY